MTEKEHQLMVLMFARMNEAMEMVSDTLKSRGLWTDDDQAAFSHIAHSDKTKISRYLWQARLDYQKFASQLGVVTGLEEPPPSS